MPAHPVVRVLQTTSSSDVNALGRILSESFAASNDPITFPVLLKTTPDLGPEHMSAHVRTAMRDGQVWTASLEDGNAPSVTAGAALWYPPSNLLQAPSVSEPLPERVAVDGKVAADALRWRNETYSPLSKALSYSALQPYSGIDNLYYLHILAVHPDCQRRGAAKALLDAFLQRADAQGIGCALEAFTPENVALYQRFGFEVKGTTTVPSPIGDILVSCMYRPPTVP